MESQDLNLMVVKLQEIIMYNVQYMENCQCIILIFSGLQNGQMVYFYKMVTTVLPIINQKAS